MDNEKTEKISRLSIRILKSRLDTIPNDSTNLRNMPFHIAFLKAFYDKLGFKNSGEAAKFLTLSSWFQGLNTTLGQIYFEEVARILIKGNKKTFKDYKIKKNVANKISDIINKLKDGAEAPNLNKENSALKNSLSDSAGGVQTGLSFTADVYFEDEKKVIMVELKSVRPNSGEMRGEKNKILNGKAYLMDQKPNKEIYYYIGFPFDPTELPNRPYDYNKVRFTNSLIEFNKFFAEEEVLLGSELWDFLSGEKNTMEKILGIINTIATADFAEKLNTINTFTFLNMNKLYEEEAVNEENFRKYIGILDEWNLYSEIDCANMIREISKNPIDASKKRLTRSLTKSMFKKNGNTYNEKRKQTCKDFAS